MIRSHIVKCFNARLYRPLRPLISERTAIYNSDLPAKPKGILYQIPAILIFANNVLTSWSILSTAGFAFAVVAGNALFYFNIVKWISTITHISTNQKFDKLFIRFPSEKLFQSIKLP